MDMRRALAAFVVAGVTAACAPPALRPTEPAGGVPAGFPAAYYQSAVARGDAVFRIDPALSVVVIEVRRAGSLARLGHDHVVASHDVRGSIAPQTGVADLYVPLGLLVVDESTLRAEAGFDTQPSADDIAGTRRNMLTRVLEIERYPYAVVAVKGVASGVDHPVADVAITLHGVTRTMQVPLRIETRRDEMAVTGSVAIAQTDFGITPLSILGGAIQVADEVRLHMEISAHRCVSRCE